LLRRRRAHDHSCLPRKRDRSTPLHGGERMSTRFELDAGAPLFVESSSAVPLVSIVVSIRSGAIADPEGKDGVCRFAARMLRRGADGMRAQDIEATIDR